MNRGSGGGRGRGGGPQGGMGGQQRWGAPGGGGGGPGGRGGPGGWGGPRGPGPQSFGQNGDIGDGKQECTYNVPANKCGIIIGKGEFYTITVA